MSNFQERLNLFKSPLQGLKISKLVNNQDEWLKNTFPRTYEGYKQPTQAIKNVGRLALKYKEVKASIIYSPHNHEVIGLSSAVKNQTIIHPKIGEINGTELYYWLNPDADDFHHKLVARELIISNADNITIMGNARKTDNIKAIGRATFKVFTTVPIDQENPPLGLMGMLVGLNKLRLNPIGDPAILNIPEGENDIYDLTKSGRLSQVYVGKGVLSKNII